MRYQLFAAIVCAALAVGGCAPGINISVTPQDQTSATVTADISADSSSLQGPARLSVRTLPTAQVTDLGDMPAVDSNTYEGLVENLDPYRTHEAIVSIDYKPLFSATTQTKTAVKPFNLPAPAGCFTFADAAAGTDGWTFIGIFDGLTDTVITQPGCPAEGLAVRLAQSLDGGSGSLNVPVTDVCFPTTADSGQWRFDLLSPDLAGNGAWQNISGVTFRAFSNVPVKVQPIVQFTDAQGNQRSRAPADANGDFIFYDVAGQQSVVIEGLVEIPAGSTVQRVRLRFFGVPAETVIGEGLIRVDAICPIPQ